MAKQSQTGKAVKTAPQQTTMPQVAPEKPPFVPFTTEQKKEYGKQFSPEQKRSYYAGQENAYRHSANMAGRQAKFIHDNKDK